MMSPIYSWENPESLEILQNTVANPCKMYGSSAQSIVKVEIMPCRNDATYEARGKMTRDGRLTREVLRERMSCGGPPRAIRDVLVFGSVVSVSILDSERSPASRQEVVFDDGFQGGVGGWG